MDKPSDLTDENAKQATLPTSVAVQAGQSNNVENTATSMYPKIEDDTQDSEEQLPSRTLELEAVSAPASPVENTKHGDSAPIEEKKEPERVLHHIKRIRFFQHTTYLCLQNLNGPCPLLCLANILFLRGTFDFPKIYIEPQVMPSDRLVELVANYLLESYSAKAKTNPLLEKTLADVIALLPSLQTGLDVNVRFNASDAFEFSPVISVFDLLNVRLLHGWLADPEDKATYAIVKDLSYNQVTNAIVTSVEETPEVAVMRNFLLDNQSQLTMHGLSELYSTVRDNELFAFFRNNHFFTGYKTRGKIFLLLTDEGYRQTVYCWEELSDLSGDNKFVPDNFGFARQQGMPQSFENLDKVDPRVIERQRRELARLKEASERQKQQRTQTNYHRKINDKKKSGCTLS